MLKLRIQILEQGGVISERVAESMRNVIDVISRECPQLEEDKLSMFTTHMAMCLERITKNEIVEPMELYMWKEVKESPTYNEALRLNDLLKKEIEISIPESEEQFLVLHLCSILQD